MRSSRHRKWMPLAHFLGPRRIHTHDDDDDDDDDVVLCRYTAGSASRANLNYF